MHIGIIRLQALGAGRYPLPSLALGSRFCQASALTHPDIAALVTPLFAVQKEGFKIYPYYKNPLYDLS